VNLSRAVFLDRDGTLIEERDYLSQPAEVVPFSDAADALRSLRGAGFKLFIVTNQSGVGRGYFTSDDVDRVNAHMVRLFARHGAQFEKIYVAPEAPDQPSRGRKPSPQFLFDARDEFGLDLGASYMIGDKWNAGVKKSILVRTGYGIKTARENAARLEKAVQVEDLTAAARWIVEQR
jgi:D-glycero-D-manno-heptose 1,7-bisphosphate phosphatase